MRGPTSPVCRQGKPCSEPASGASLIFTWFENGALERFAVTAGKNGRYFASLPPGDYTVSTRPSVGRGIEPSTVRVVAGRSRTVDFKVDTGIR